MRQFVSEHEVDEKGRLCIEGKKARHLVSVLRVQPGDMVYVRLPSGVLQQMTVAFIDGSKKNVTLQVAGESAAVDACGGAKAPPVQESLPLELWLFQFVAKPPKMDLIIRQAVECGVLAIVPVEGTFCQSGPIESARKKTCGNDDRWSRIITEAREQSGSAVQTKVLSCVSVEQAVKLWKETCAGEECGAFVLYEQTAGTKPLHSALKSFGRPLRKAALFVGAEGGISPEEIEFLQNEGIVPVHFATNILRCETAALYGLAAIQNAIVEYEEWQSRE